MAAKNEAKIKFTAETSGLNKAISEAKSKATELRSEMKLNESQFKATGDKATYLEQKAQILTRQLEENGNIQEALTEKYEKAVEIYGENSTEATKLQTQLNNVKAQENDLQAALNDTNKELDESGEEMQEGAGKAGEYEDSVDGASKKTEVFGQVLLANLASSAIKAGFSALVDGVKAVGKALADTVVDGAAYADEILTMATQTGIATDKLQEFKYMEDLIDVDLSTITGSMTKLTKSMANAKDGTGSAADAFAALGVSVTDSNGQLRDNEDVFNDVIDALGAMENPTERDALAMALMGKSAQELNPLIEAGSDTLEAFAEQARESGYVLDSEQLAKLGEADDAFRTYEKTVEGIKNQLAVGLAPAVTQVGGVFQDLVKNIDWSYVSGQIGNIAQKASELIQTTDWSGLLESAKSGIEGVATAIGSIDIVGVASGLASFASAVMSIGGWVMANGQTIIAVVAGIGTAIAGLKIVGLITAMTGLVAGPLALIPLAIGAVVAAGVWLVQNWDMIKAKAIELKNNVVAKVTELKTNAINAFNALKQGAIEKVNALKQSAVEKVNGLKQSAVEKIEGMKQSVVEKFNSLKSSALEKVESLKSSITSKFNSIKEKILSPVEKARDGVKRAVDRIKGFFSGLHLSLPHIKLPHFSVSGKFSLNPPSIPHFGVSWYAKAMDNPMILKRATIFGRMGDNFLAGGEAGREMIGGVDTVSDMISNAVGASNNIDYDRLGRTMAQACAELNLRLIISDREVGRVEPA